jgi:uncharacterized protein with ATP-grasp and redox domains
VSTEDPGRQREILNRVMTLLSRLPPEQTPPQMAQAAHRVVREMTGNPDPYAEIKRQYNEKALEQLPACRRILSQASDPLETAVRLSVAGNVIDFGGGWTEFDLEGELRAVLDTPFHAWDYDRFRQDLSQARSILFLGDNTGEIVLDRLLVEAIRQVSSAEITFVVRGSPVLNDATVEDAHYAGLEEVARVVGNGSDAPGTVLQEVCPEVREAFRNAEMIISKGQGNFETLDNEPGNIYFLFKVKCAVVARMTGAEEGSYMLAGSMPER